MPQLRGKSIKLARACLLNDAENAAALCHAMPCGKQCGWGGGGWLALLTSAACCTKMAARGCFNLSLRVKLCQRLSTFYAPSAACGVLYPRVCIEGRNETFLQHTHTHTHSLSLCVRLPFAIDCDSCICTRQSASCHTHKGRVENFLNLNVKFTEPAQQTHSVTFPPPPHSLLPCATPQKTLMLQLLQSRAHFVLRRISLPHRPLSY